MSAIEDCGATQGENYPPSRSANSSFIVPLGSATSGRLVFPAGATGVTLVAEPALQGLARCRLVRRVAWVGFEKGIVMVGYRPDALSPHSPPLDWLADPHKPGDEIMLNASIPWEIEFRGGASRITARLGGLLLRSLDVLGEASQIVLELSRPAGTTYLYLAGDCRQVTIQRPPNVGVGIYTQDGMARLSLDGQRFRSLGSDTRLESAGFNRTDCRYEISIAGGVNQVTIYERRS